MPDKKISELTEQTVLTDNDEFPIIRNESGTYVNYKVKKSNFNTTVIDATSSSKGIIKLTGDLGGTADSPTVPDLSLKVNISSLASVALSGDYSDLTSKPNIPSAQVNSDWASTTGVSQILNKPTIPTLVSQLTNDSEFITTNLVTSVASKTGAVTLTKSDVGLSNIDNTTDLNKPISTATQTALDLKQDNLIFVPENVSNKSTSTSLGTSNILYPTQNAVKAYVDSALSAGTSTLPNGTLINNVCYINQSARPTTRPNSSALVVGDRWYNSATGVEGFWNGTYWLAEKEDISIVNQLITSSTNYTLFGYIPPNKQVLVSSITFSVQSSYTGDISNFYNIYIVPANRHGAYSTVQIINNIYQSNIPAQTNIVYPLNAVSPSLPTGGNGLTLGYGWNCYQLWATKTGTPSNFNFTLCVYAREIL